MTYPRWRKFSLQITTAMPASNPMATRPAGPIQLLSKANFRKYETPISTAVMPIRFSQCDPMRDSRSARAALDGTLIGGCAGADDATLGVIGATGFISAPGAGGEVWGRSVSAAALGGRCSDCSIRNTRVVSSAT